MNTLWLEDKDIDPAFDLAMRDWARTSKKVAKIVQDVDQERIASLTTMFRNLGYEPDVALVRARIAFTQQVGYYVLGIKDSKERRHDLSPIYLQVLLGT